MEEHFVHVGHIGDIPLADVASEFAMGEHLAHICHVGDIPIADIFTYTYKNDSVKHHSVGNNKVLRGGCWSDYASSCRVTHRFYDVSSSKSSKIGFRVVCVP